MEPKLINGLLNSSPHLTPSFPVVITGRWAGTNMRPAVSGGPLYRREYWFHSLHLHWPSEHAIDDGVLPFETQSVHVADGYCDLAQATNAFTAGLDNKSTVLIISNMYRVSVRLF